MNSKQRAMLRSMANTLETILYIGKDGVTDAKVATRLPDTRCCTP